MAVSASSVHLLSIFDAAMRLMAVQERAQWAKVGAVAVGGRRLPGVEERFSKYFFSSFGSPDTRTRCLAMHGEWAKRTVRALAAGNALLAVVPAHAVHVQPVCFAATAPLTIPSCLRGRATNAPPCRRCRMGPAADRDVADVLARVDAMMRGEGSAPISSAVSAPEASSPDVAARPHGASAAVSAASNWQHLSARADRILCCHAGKWTHYDVAALTGCPQPVSRPAECALSTGRLRQTSRFVDEGRGMMEVWNVFEAGALSQEGGIGGMGALSSAQSDAAVRHRDADGHHEMVATIRLGDANGVVISPGEASFAGDCDLSGPAVLELCLSESSGATLEALKVGVCLKYGDSGELQQLTRIRQLALRDPDEITGITLTVTHNPDLRTLTKLRTLTPQPTSLDPAS